MAATDTQEILDHTVKTGTAFGSWTARSNLWCRFARGGNCKVAGKASFVERYGYTFEDGVGSQVAPLSVLGHYVAVNVDDDDIWWGVLTNAARRPGAEASDGSGQVEYEAVHILKMLDRIFPNRGLEWNPNVGTSGYATETGLLLPFNESPDGDMHTDDDATRDCRLHNRSGTGTYWTAYQVIRTVLQLYANRFINPAEGQKQGPQFELASSANLNFQAPPIDPNGKSVAEIINSLVNPSRSLDLRIQSVVGDTITLEVVSTAATEVVIDSTTVAAASGTSLDFDDDGTIKDLVINQSMPPYEAVFGFGARPVYGISLWYQVGNSDSSLVPDGWSTSDVPTDQAEDEAVWHKFKIADGWSGLQYNKTDSGIPNTWEPAGILPTGYAAWHGFPPTPRHLELTTELPASEGWGTDQDGPRQKAIALIGNDSDGWRVIKTAMVCGKGWVRLGTNRKDALILKNRLISGNNYLVVTVGARAWAPITVGTTGSSSTWTREVPPVITIDRSDMRYDCMLAGTTKGVNSSGVLQNYSADTAIRDDVPEFQRFIAMAAAAYRRPRGSVSFSKPGVIDVSNYKPGTLIDTVDAHGTEYEVNSIIQTVTWRFEGDYGTYWEGVPRKPGVGVMI